MVTATIIGPRTVQQLLDLVETIGPLDDDVLDGIDAIVPPGTNLYAPNKALPASLADKNDRRRLKPNFRAR
jgi:hypothetical protein